MTKNATMTRKSNDERNVRSRRKVCEMDTIKRERECDRASLAKFVRLFPFCINNNYFVANALQLTERLKC